jgi:ParB-like nuclease domain
MHIHRPKRRNASRALTATPEGGVLSRSISEEQPRLTPDTPKAAVTEPSRTIAIEPLSVASLRPYPGNPRTHSRKQVRQIAESIRRFGFTNPVLIGEGGEIIAGHGRVEAAKLLGLESVPTVRLAHLDAAQRRAYGHCHVGE